MTERKQEKRPWYRSGDSMDRTDEETETIELLRNIKTGQESLRQTLESKIDVLKNDLLLTLEAKLKDMKDDFTLDIARVERKLSKVEIRLHDFEEKHQPCLQTNAMHL